jgi:ApbE superfamily uncharacterized protein (UPF0280 family)
MKGFGQRFYREQMGVNRFRSFTISCKDSDLWIGVDIENFNTEMIDFAYNKLVELRYSLESYINYNPLFGSSYLPVKTNPDDPEIAIEMSKAGEIANTGPMAAVAGAFSEYIAKALLNKFKLNEIVVENGGDIFLKLKNDLILSVYAGDSPLSGKIGLEIPAWSTPLGVCTSAGTVGPSVSFGKADAVVIASKNAALADAFATAYGNIVKTADDIKEALELAKKDKKILSALIICEGKVGICGQFEVIPLATKMKISNNQVKPPHL